MHQDPNTALSENSLLHGEALLVTASHDLEHVALEFLQGHFNSDLKMLKGVQRKIILAQNEEQVK
jgi:hypothetical protein